LDDGTVVTSYSWRDAEHVTHVEVIRWRLLVSILTDEENEK